MLANYSHRNCATLDRGTLPGEGDSAGDQSGSKVRHVSPHSAAAG